MDAEYTGYKIVRMGDEELAAFYTDDDDVKQSIIYNAIDCLTNEYLIIINNAGDVVDKLRWDGYKFVKVSKKPFSTKFGGKVSARNLQQELAIDMIQNDNITVKMIAGRFGSGKTFLFSAAAVQMVQSGKFDRIIFVRNNIEVKNSKGIGYLPGEKDEKIRPWASPLADHLGDETMLEMMIRDRKVEMQPLCFIRGRDIKHSIIFVTEAENLTKEHIQLLISRVGEGSQIWFDGDLKQRDAEVFVRNSGMALAIERLAGHHKFGYVKLLKSERSETAAMADLLDDNQNDSTAVSIEVLQDLF